MAKKEGIADVAEIVAVLVGLTGTLAYIISPLMV